MIFEDQEKKHIRVCNYILQDLGEHTITKDTLLKRIDRPSTLDWFGAVRFFDGASHERGSKCGARATMKCLIMGTYKLKLNCGK
jgi:hypothetical protein